MMYLVFNEMLYSLLGYITEVYMSCYLKIKNSTKGQLDHVIKVEDYEIALFGKFWIRFQLVFYCHANSWFPWLYYIRRLPTNNAFHCKFRILYVICCELDTFAVQLWKMARTPHGYVTTPADARSRTRHQINICARIGRWRGPTYVYLILFGAMNVFWYSLLSWCLSSGACYSSTQVSTTAYVEVSIEIIYKLSVKSLYHVRYYNSGHSYYNGYIECRVTICSKIVNS